MKTNQEIARREPPAGLGLSACSTVVDASCKVCHKIKMAVQVTNLTQFPAYVYRSRVAKPQRRCTTKL